MLLALLVQPKLGENMSLWLKIAAGFRNVNDNHALSPPRVTSSFFIRTIRLSGKYKRENKEYGYSLALPKTKLSLTLRDGAALQREKKIQKKFGFTSLYQWQLTQDRDQQFVLHDGPPYANGSLHVGHAVNKILKDIVNRYKLLQGYKIKYLPGWDCHGLPIELKAIKQEGEIKPLSPSIIRSKARRFAQKVVRNQKLSFQKWGILGDWDNAYQTMDVMYSVNQLNVFYEMYKKGLIYQEFMPVYWSPSSRTALAEAELVYNPNHVSQSLWLTFPVAKIPDKFHELIQQQFLDRPFYLLVWTTTPWTIPANQAICFSPQINYCCILANDNIYICCEEFLPSVNQILGTNYKILCTFNGDVFSTMIYHHPISLEELPLYPAKHVTSAKGTGLVHTAPAHGHDDFHIAIEHKLPMKCLLGEDGSYLPEAGPHLAGKTVGVDANTAVLDLLGKHVLKVEDYKHSYPYDWRTQKPVIICASKQWFVNTQVLKNKAIECLRSVTVYPHLSENGMLSQLDSRTYWCISRQRVWGLPIPVFYHRTSGKPFITRSSIEHIASVFVKQGTDAWWDLPIEQLLPKHILKENNAGEATDYVKGKDIFDIWFDSGTSWSVVLKEMNYEADLYLEGLDQFGAWFQTSLLTSIAMKEKSPYKSIVVHGFTVDESGKKMSKSVGNVINPDDIINGSKDGKMPSYGVDVLRWWAASYGLHTNVPIGHTILAKCNEEIFRIRKSCRFLLGNLFNFSPSEHLVSYELLLPQDRYMLHLLYMFAQKLSELYATHRYNKMTSIIESFINSDVSSFYSTIIKDRCYCDGHNGFYRRSCQTVQYHILHTILYYIAPILPHFAEELFEHMPKPFEYEGVESVFMTPNFKIDPQWLNLVNFQDMQPILNIREKFNEVIGPESPTSFDAIIWATGNLHSNLKMLQPTDQSINSPLVEILQASQVNLTSHKPDSVIDDAEITAATCSVYLKDGSTSDENFTLIILPSEKHPCVRCRRSTANTPKGLCRRCLDVLADGYE